MPCLYTQWEGPSGIGAGVVGCLCNGHFPFVFSRSNWKNTRGERGLSSGFSMFSACSCGTRQLAGQCAGHPVAPTRSEFQHLPLSGWLLMENIPATVASLIHLKTATKIISLKHKFKMDGGNDCTTM